MSWWPKFHLWIKKLRKEFNSQVHNISHLAYLETFDFQKSFNVDEEPEFHGFTDADVQDKPEVAKVSFSSDEDFDIKEKFMQGSEPPLVVDFVDFSTNDNND